MFLKRGPTVLPSQGMLMLSKTETMIKIRDNEDKQCDVTGNSNANERR